MDEQEQLLKVSEPENVVRVGIEINKNTHLRKLNQREPLGKVIEEICKAFNLQEHEKYGLQFDNHSTLLYSYITEDNRHEIKDGSVCKLVYSPAVLVQTILAKMVSPGSEENIWSLQKILSFMQDRAFVEKFVDGKGVTILVTLLQGNALSYEATGYAFKCAAELLNYGFVPIESIKDRILDKVIHFILNQKEGSARTQESCLSICHTLMEKHAETFPEIYKTISIEKVIPHLSNSNFWVQQTALGLINSIFNVANTLQRKLLIKAYAKQIREVVYKNIIQVHKIIPEEMARHLALFQSRFISRLRRKAESAVDMADNLVKKRIKALARLTLDEEEGAEKIAAKRNTFVETTLTLLSDYVIPPPIDTSEVPPSILVLDCMTHFTKTYHKNYTKAVLEHSIKTAGSEYPFVQLCSQLIGLLTDALGITTITETKDLTYHPVLFSCDKAFEELFCASIMVFSKTSKEMRAKSEDFQKVMNVVKKKIQVSLSKKPLALKEYEAKFYTLSYNDISQVWQEELQIKERADLREKKSLLQIKEEIKPVFIDLIKKHRLYALTRGAQFPKFSPRGSVSIYRRPPLFSYP